MSLRRVIGRWSLTALIVNTVIGSGIYGAPSEVTAMVGRAGPLAWIFAAVGMGLMMACFAEVASQFCEAGGAYLYARSALGRFAGLQVAWFSWLAPAGACAASTILFINYMAGFMPGAARPGMRAVLIVAFLGLLTLANVIGVRSGTNLSNFFTVAKLVPLAVLIVAGTVHFTRLPHVISMQEISAPGWRGWLDVLLLLSFAYAGFETALIPAGEMKHPRKEIPIALGLGLLTCSGTYALVQWVSELATTAGAHDRPLAVAATHLIGASGAALMMAGAMISAYGSVSAMVLASPRLTFSMAERGEFPALFGRVHSRFNTPHLSIVVFGAFTAILALTGTFRWLLMLASGAIIVIYGAICVSLIVLRRKYPNADALRIPGGNLLAIVCVAIAIALLMRLSKAQALLLIATAVIATFNWALVRDRRQQTESLP